MRKERGFSLAEIVVTLMIIGVIAAMTLPSLRQTAEEREKVAQVKKAYSILTQATERAEQDNGPIKTWDSSKLNEIYKPYFNIAQECPPGKGCFTEGNRLYPNNAKDTNYGVSGILLADGISIKINSGLGSKESYGISPDDITNAKGMFYVDINGPKPRNKWGEDVFLFVLVKDKGVLPSGYYDESKCITTYGCAAYVLREGKLQNYKDKPKKPDEGSSQDDKN